MKHTLLILVCLSLGCAEEFKEAKVDKPVVCPMSMAMPLSEILIKGMQAQKFYQYKINNKILWDDCAKTSEMILFYITTNPNPDTNSRFQGFFEEELQNQTVRARVFELNQCVVDINPIFDEVLNITTSKSTYGDPDCGGSYTKKQLHIIF